MPTEVRPISQKFYSELSNGSSFNLNTSDFATHLKGNVDEKLRAVIRVQVGSWVELSNYRLQIYDTTKIRITMSGGGFNDNFNIGDSIIYNFGLFGYEVDVEQVTDDWIDGVITSTLPDGGIVSNNGFLTTYESGWLSNNTTLTGLEYKFGLIENDEPTNYNSKLTNTEQLLRFSPITGSSVNGVPAGNNSAWKTGNSTCRFIGSVADNNITNPFTTWKEFEIVHEFIINPSYRDGELNALKGSESAPDDIFQGTKSLKYVFECGFMRTITDENTKKIGEWNRTRGSVGYRDESFNGFPTTYKATSVSYFNVTDGIATDRLTIGKTVRVTATITDSSNSFVAGNPFVVGHAAIVPSTDYTFNTLEYQKVWTFDTKRNTLDNAANSAGIFSNVKADVLGVGEIEVEFDVTFSGDQLSRLENGQDYQIFVHLQKNGQTVDTGSKTKVVLDVNVYDKNADVFGLFGVDRHEQFKHDNDYVDLSSIGTTNAKVDVEEGLLTMGYFWLDLSLGAVLDALNFRLATYNTVTGDTGILRSVSLDLSDQFIVDGSQQIVLDTTRGFILKDNDQFNYLKINTDVKIGDKQYYEVLVGWKTPYQTWIEYLQADPVFYDRNEPFNNLNEFSANYSNLNDYQLRTFIDADVSNGESITTYRDSSENISVWDYDEDDQGQPDSYICTINTYSKDGAAYERKIIKSGFTEVRGEFIPVVPPVFSTNVDFNDVATTWQRFALGTKYIRTGGGIQRFPNWNNDQGDDNDVFQDFFLNDYTRISANLFTSTSTQILSTQNTGAHYGCLSPEKLEYYEIGGKMFSNEGDNDSIIFQVAYYEDEDGVEHTLSLVCTTGGVSFDINPAFIPGNTDFSPYLYIATGSTIAGAALIVDYGKSSWVKLAEFYTGAIGYHWNNAAVGDLAFNVKRSGDSISASIDWTINAIQYTDTMSINLNDDPSTLGFKGVRQYGFGVMSQGLGGFKDVALVQPSADYYGILRALPFDAPSDASITELSSIREASTDNLLIQITGDTVNSLLSWDGDKFIVQGIVNQAVLDPNTRYKLSAEIKLRGN